ncbi:uncharacterized protein LOC105683568 isoform X2 [Athalia rosae]|uniref:uncharacterized protein LOC105683568 isoform X2 n=1 Tax=Athalia rosae TaxID=37344 RepID=UPI0020332C94|nr:uncharacterized protein LOC105683568 isoform X2 [Athalia rosae]
MVLWATILILQGASLVAYPCLFEGSMPGIPGVPENITVMFVNPTSVRVSWSTSQVDQIEKYDVTYKPTDASLDRVVAVVAGNSEAVTLSGLTADTQYQLVVTAVRAGKKLRSRPIVFRTLEPPRTSPQQDAAGAVTGGPTPPPPPSAQQPQPYIQIRGVEVGIVVLVLVVWAGAIALFFNRWGKIRMLLPYQPDYKEQLKVPGTGVCAAATTSCNQHSTQHACSQHLHWSNHHVDSLDSGGGLGWPRPTRPRVNSAIDVAGFLSQEFVRRHGSTSRLCRKVRSADNLPLATSSSGQHDRRELRNIGDDLAEDDRHDDRETFLKNSANSRDHERDSRDQRRTRDDEVNFYAQINQENVPRESDIAVQESPYHQQTFRDSGTATTATSLVARRFGGGWRVGGSHEYVRCPVRQPASMDERFYRRSCDPDFGRSHRHHNHPPGHHLHHVDHHARSCDYARRTPETSLDQTPQHFGLPILSISEPSPPDEMDRVDEYL